MKKIGEETLGEGKWLSLKRSFFEDSDGQQFDWEHIARKGSRHAVVILATLRPSNDILLIRQFRPGANAFVLALPAGMAEKDHQPGEDALRELQEETGYHGIITDIGPVVSSFPALSDATVQLVQVDIDETLPENQNPKQQLEVGEIIQTLRIPRRNIRQFLRDEVQRGAQVVSGLWYLFAISEEDS